MRQLFDQFEERFAELERRRRPPVKSEDIIAIRLGCVFLAAPMFILRNTRPLLASCLPLCGNGENIIYLNVRSGWDK